MTLSYLSHEIKRPLEWVAAPSVRLRPFIECYYGLIIPAWMPISFGQRSAPSGNVILHFAFGAGRVCETQYAYKPNEVVKKRPNQAIILPKRVSWRVNLEGMSDLVLVKIKAGMAAPFLNLSLSELDAWMDAEEIWPSFAMEQLSELEYSSIQKRIPLIERVLIQCLEQSTLEVDQTINQALTLIKSKRGCLEVQTLAKHLNISDRQLRRKFQHHVGLTPKQYNNIIRFRYANRLIKQQPTKSLTEVAHNAGYFDLAHFTHAIQKITGIPPSQMSAIDQQALQVHRQNSDYLSLHAT